MQFNLRFFIVLTFSFFFFLPLASAISWEVSDTQNILQLNGTAFYLTNLTDVNAPSPNNNDTLKWDDGTSNWVSDAISNIISFFTKAEVVAMISGNRTEVEGDIIANTSELLQVITDSNASWSADTNASVCDDGNYLNGNGLCILLNSSIDDRVASITYLPINISVYAGTYDSGNVSDLFMSRDGFTYNVSEVAGANPLVVIINFTGVVNFNTLEFGYSYGPTSAHEIAIGIFECAVGYDEDHKPDLVDTASFSYLDRSIIDSGIHVCDGNVSVRFRHVNFGNPTHDFSLEMVRLVQGSPQSSPTETDPFALHKDGSTPLTDNWKAGKFNITLDSLFSRSVNVTDSILLNNIDVGTWLYNQSKPYDNFNYNQSQPYDLFNYNQTTPANSTIFNTYDVRWSSTFNITYDKY